MYVREGCAESQRLKGIYMLAMRAAPPMRAPRATAAVGIAPACLLLEVAATAPDEAAAASEVALFSSLERLAFAALLVSVAS